MASGRRSAEETLSYQRKVLAAVRSGAKTQIEAGKKAHVPHRTVADWYQRNVHGFRDKWKKAAEKRDGIFEEKPDVPDFYTLRQKAWGHETFPYHREWNEAIESNDRVLILTPPAHSKTTFLEEYVAYRIIKDRNVRVIVVSKTQDVAKKRLRRIGQILTDDAWYRRNRFEVNVPEEWGPFRTENTRGQTQHNPWSDQMFYVAGIDSGERDPTVEALGVGNQIQGARADLIVLDDIATLSNQTSELMRERVLEWIAQECTTRLTDGGKLVAIGTRVHELDIYRTLIEAETYHKVIHPAILDEDKEEVLSPVLWPFEALVKRRKELEDQGKLRTWLLTYQQQATGLPDQPFKAEVLEEALDPQYHIGHVPQGTIPVMGVDPAFSGTAAIVVLALDRASGQRYLVDVIAQSGLNTNDRLKNFIIQAAAKYSVREARIEKNAMQGGIARDFDLVTRLKSVGTRAVEEFTSDHNKFDIDLGVSMVAGLFEAGRYTLPGDPMSRGQLRPFMDELQSWRAEVGRRQTQDMVMALWLAELSCRRFMQSQESATKVDPRVPKAIHRRAERIKEKRLPGAVISRFRRGA